MALESISAAAGFGMSKRSDRSAIRETAILFALLVGLVLYAAIIGAVIGYTLAKAQEGLLRY